jgi:hypothetical protein
LCNSVTEGTPASYIAWGACKSSLTRKGARYVYAN